MSTQKKVAHKKKGKIVSGVKVEDLVVSETGSSRSDRDGKGRFDLIPACALRRLALRFEGGATAHGVKIPIAGLQWSKKLVYLCTCKKKQKEHLNKSKRCS